MGLPATSPDDHGGRTSGRNNRVRSLLAYATLAAHVTGVLAAFVWLGLRRALGIRRRSHVRRSHGGVIPKQPVSSRRCLYFTGTWRGSDCGERAVANAGDCPPHYFVDRGLVAAVGRLAEYEVERRVEFGRLLIGCVFTLAVLFRVLLMIGEFRAPAARGADTDYAAPIEATRARGDETSAALAFVVADVVGAEWRN